MLPLSPHRDDFFIPDFLLLLHLPSGFAPLPCALSSFGLSVLFLHSLFFGLSFSSRSLHLLSHSRPSREELPVARVVQELTHILRWSKS